MSFETLTHKHLTNLKSEIQAVMASKNLDNTGEASQSLEISGNQLIGLDYIFYLDKGRSPGKFPPVQNLRDWVESKLGLSSKESKSVAFLIGRKMANEGSGIYRNNAKGLQLELLVNNMLEDLTKELPDEAAAEALKWL